MIPLGRLTGCCYVINTRTPKVHCVCGHPHDWTRLDWASYTFVAGECGCGCTIYEPDEEDDEYDEEAAVRLAFASAANRKPK